MTLGSNTGLDDTMVLHDSAGNSHQHGPGDGMALRHSHDHRVQSRPKASVWSSVATLTMDINKYSGCGRTMNPDMVLGSSPAQISPCSQVVAQATRVDLVSEWPRGTNMDGPRWRR